MQLNLTGTGLHWYFSECVELNIENFFTAQVALIVTMIALILRGKRLVPSTVILI